MPLTETETGWVVNEAVPRPPLLSFMRRRFGWGQRHQVTALLLGCCILSAAGCATTELPLAAEEISAESTVAKETATTTTAVQTETGNRPSSSVETTTTIDVVRLNQETEIYQWLADYVSPAIVYQQEAESFRLINTSWLEATTFVEESQRLLEDIASDVPTLLAESELGRTLMQNVASLGEVYSPQIRGSFEYTFDSFLLDRGQSMISDEEKSKLLLAFWEQLAAEDGEDTRVGFERIARFITSSLGDFIDYAEALLECSSQPNTFYPVEC